MRRTCTYGRHPCPLCFIISNVGLKHIISLLTFVTGSSHGTTTGLLVQSSPPCVLTRKSSAKVLFSYIPSMYKNILFEFLCYFFLIGRVFLKAYFLCCVVHILRFPIIMPTGLAIFPNELVHIPEL